MHFPIGEVVYETDPSCTSPWTLGDSDLLCVSMDFYTRFPWYIIMTRKCLKWYLNHKFIREVRNTSRGFTGKYVDKTYTIQKYRKRILLSTQNLQRLMQHPELDMHNYILHQLRHFYQEFNRNIYARKSNKYIRTARRNNLQ